MLGKTTIVNPKSQIGSTKSRMDVLESIYKLFQVSCLLPTEKFWFLKGQNGAESVPRSLHYADHWLPPKEQAALQFNPFSSKGATNRKELGSSEFYSMSKLEKTAPVAGHSRDTQGLDLIVRVPSLS